MSDEVANHSFPITEAKAHGWKLLLSQNGELSKNVLEEEVPKFPWAFLMIPLWENTKRNWRVLQASAHIDIRAALLWGEHFKGRSRISFETRPENVFDHYRHNFKYICKNDLDRWLYSLLGKSNKSLGLVFEALRSILASAVLNNSRSENANQIDNWTPRISAEKASIPISKYLVEKFEFTVDENFDHEYSQKRLIWECQTGLLSKIQENSGPYQIELIMLCILGYPLLSVEPRTSSGILYTSQESSSHNIHFGTIINIRALNAPQEISIDVCVENNEEAMLVLHHELEDAVFQWEDWVNAGMGIMAGIHDWREKNDQFDCCYMKADFSKGMGYFFTDSATVQGRVPVWMAWPSFNLKICQFELDQCMLNRGILNPRAPCGQDSKLSVNMELAENSLREYLLTMREIN